MCVISNYPVYCAVRAHRVGRSLLHWPRGDRFIFIFLSRVESSTHPLLYARQLSSTTTFVDARWRSLTLVDDFQSCRIFFWRPFAANQWKLGVGREGRTHLEPILYTPPSRVDVAALLLVRRRGVTMIHTSTALPLKRFRMNPEAKDKRQPWSTHCLCFCGNNDNKGQKSLYINPQTAVQVSLRILGWKDVCLCV